MLLATDPLQVLVTYSTRQTPSNHENAGRLFLLWGYGIMPASMGESPKGGE